jgi:hypothetical protein
VACFILIGYLPVVALLPRQRSALRRLPPRSRLHHELLLCGLLLCFLALIAEICHSIG